jgi:biopolymer transport protein TolQ
MLILLAASMVSWWMIVQRWLFFRQAGSENESFEQDFWGGADLSKLYHRGTGELNDDKVLGGQENIFRAGYKEYSRLSQQSVPDGDAMVEGAQRQMRIALNREQNKLELYLSFLATVGSTSPYIGLFGTVWGIMNSFRGLANVQQATLAVVAPGISEALIATAIGLFAAIPAVIAYNRFSSQADNLMHQFETFSQEIISILHRQAVAFCSRDSGSSD